ncbi:hypothetical protein [Nocardioides nanhaiensis]|uniref:hypothetical protein n=1 Tax=Nocardioides nanhaiensis TaxID=1476871 RepID=UPI0031EDA18A
MDEHKPPGEEPDDVGSVGEEAAKLFGALSDWARDQGDGATAGLGGLAAHAAAAAREVDEHLATGSAECTYCPICRTVHAVRQVSPEVREHLVSAASSFLQAASAMLATQLPDQRPPASAAPGGRRGTDPGRRRHVEPIDLDPGEAGDPGDPGDPGDQPAPSSQEDPR